MARPDPTRDVHSAYAPPQPRLPDPSRPPDRSWLTMEWVGEPRIRPWFKAHHTHIVRAIIGAAVVALLWWGISACVAWDSVRTAEIEREREAWKSDPTNPKNICITRGGVPITSWGNLDRCDFPRGGAT